MREAIPVQERLAVTLRFLASGDSYMSLSYLFKISKQSIYKIVPEVCVSIIHVLKEYIKVSETIFHLNIIYIYIYIDKYVINNFVTKNLKVTKNKHSITVL